MFRRARSWHHRDHLLRLDLIESSRYQNPIDITPLARYSEGEVTPRFCPLVRHRTLLWLWLCPRDCLLQGGANA